MSATNQWEKYQNEKREKIFIERGEVKTNENQHSFSIIDLVFFLFDDVESLDCFFFVNKFMELV